MGYSDFILTYWEKEQRVFTRNLAVLKKHPAKKAVHDLRVAVKKLRAALELHWLISGKSLAEEPLKETEQFFTTLGKQRDIEICLEIIDENEKETGKKYAVLKNYFVSVLSFAYEWSGNAAQQYKKKELAEIALLLKDDAGVYEQDELKHKITGIINTHLVNCKSYYIKPHKLRQKLKEIYYWIKMIPGSIIPRAEYEEELNQVLEDFGNWQNLVVAEIKIKHFRKDYLPGTSPEYDATKMLEATIKEKKDALLKVAIDKTRTLLKKALATEKEKPGL